MHIQKLAAAEERLWEAEMDAHVQSVMVGACTSDSEMVAAIKNALANGTKLEYCYDGGRTALTIASVKGLPKSVALLLSATRCFSWFLGWRDLYCVALLVLCNDISMLLR